MTPLPADAGARDHVVVTHEPIDAGALVAWATRPDCGAVVVFLGVVRDHAEGRTGVESITYEAYESEAVAALEAVVADARTRWPELGPVAVVHRVGDVAVTEASVAVVVASPHRAEAFAAGQHCIDTLKQTAPIWKQEHTASGAEWVRGQPIRAIRSLDGAESPTS
ncbi:MAG TPA: molybdenum cofactor biosynthesis protein MoaE [Acidimicrobiia bacterium]|nr:molybdenum cofactor biosynthesis protein MoaE [Acidimicrobiia bacterium]